MPRYSYDNTIIIVTIVIILEFLFARFVHPDALPSFYANIRIAKASKLLINFSF